MLPDKSLNALERFRHDNDVDCTQDHQVDGAALPPGNLESNTALRLEVLKRVCNIFDEPVPVLSSGFDQFIPR